MAGLSRFLFGFAGALLVAMAIGLMGFAVKSVLFPAERLDFALLDAIGYIVIAIAVFDVAKYLVEEEVVRNRELRRAGETRQSLTRFVGTIIIATLLEAIVVIFKAARENTADLIYPTLLLFVGVALIVGLGAFQQLSATVERALGEEPSPTMDDAELNNRSGGATSKAAPFNPGNT